jgi:hypothetical protein
MATHNSLVIDKADMSWVYYSDPMWVKTFDSFSFHWWVELTGARATGWMYFQVSNEDPIQHHVVNPKPNNTDIRNWVDLDSMPPIPIYNGTPQTGMLNFSGKNFTWIRMVWSPICNGKGTLSARLVGKVGVP